MVVLPSISRVYVNKELLINYFILNPIFSSPQVETAAFSSASFWERRQHSWPSDIQTFKRVPKLIKLQASCIEEEKLLCWKKILFLWPCPSLQYKNYFCSAVSMLYLTLRKRWWSVTSFLENLGHCRASSDSNRDRQRKSEIQFAVKKIKGTKAFHEHQSSSARSRSPLRNLWFTANFLKYSHWYMNCPQMCHLWYCIQALGCWKPATL